MSTVATKLLYITIWISAFGFACLSQKTQKVGGNTKTEFRKEPFLVSFLIPWLFLILSDTGIDYKTYKEIYETVTWTNFSNLWVEPGYALLNVIIKTVVRNSTVGLVILKTLTIGLVYLTIYDYRDKIHVGFAVLGYLSLSYLDTFCLLRINLAAAMILFALSLYQNRGKKKTAVLLLIFVVTIHYSAVIFAVVAAAYVFLFRNRRYYFYSKLLVISLALVLLRIVAIPVMNFLLDTIPFLEQYGLKYSLIETSGSGMMQYIWHIPFVLVLIETWHLGKQKDDGLGSILALMLVMAPFSLFFGTMGYSVDVIGRTFVFFNFLWVIGIPCYYAWRKTKYSGINTVIIGWQVFIWNAYRFFVFIRNSLASAGIESYSFLWQ